ncbi:hypothetical protein F2Q69_00013236 [Brassica cretica]|uniref:Uncharacterized protein n=1 Tax=Brassica cretica TaxID=69181 RepID=A0A8S9R3J4_BRACR|nr:hypothetical protein F2Q69_00013236 [Brassica cretica]
MNPTNTPFLIQIVGARRRGKRRTIFKAYQTWENPRSKFISSSFDVTKPKEINCNKARELISAKLTSLTFSPPPRLLRTESRLSRCRCFLASVEFHSIVADSKLDWTGARLSLDPDRLRSKTNSLPLSVNLELYHNHLVIVKRSRRRRVGVSVGHDLADIKLSNKVFSGALRRAYRNWHELERRRKEGF